MMAYCRLVTPWILLFLTGLALIDVVAGRLVAGAVALAAFSFVAGSFYGAARVVLNAKEIRSR